MACVVATPDVMAGVVAASAASGAVWLLRPT